jgi:Flp pilus assembly protein TadG
MVGRTAAGRERGAVTAEAALMLPLLVSVTLGLVWLLALAVSQVRVTDAAREVARAAARDESDAVAVAHGARVAPDGAAIAIERGDGTVTARVEAPVAGPGGIFGFLPGVTLEAVAVAAAEESP